MEKNETNIVQKVKEILNSKTEGRTTDIIWGTVNSQTKWDIRFLELAKHVASFSKDPSTKVGAVIVRNNNEIVSLGYNGLPKGIQDEDSILNNRKKKMELIIHGEENALIFAKQSVDGCTLYTYPFICCSRCSSKMIQAGIKRVVTIDDVPDRWKENMKLSEDNFTKHGVEVVYIKI